MNVSLSEDLRIRSPGHTPSDIQSHLYLSFLHGHTADVQLHIKGHWEAVYHLHRVVLIQAGFFRSLFTAGFLESKHRSKYASEAPDEVPVRFDDANITRSAFEICVARLYGGGPELFLSPSLVPTTLSPLTPSFRYPAPPSQTPLDQHPATPRFLLSLLATSIYLSIPSVTSQAMSMVLNSIGPYTVHRYLSFSIGQGIGLPEDDEPLCAVGLENVGKQAMHLSDDSSSMAPSSIQHDDSEESSVTIKLGSLNSSETQDNASTAESQLIEPSFNYGRIGDKVGEACACWLTRWGTDILPYEETAVAEGGLTAQVSAPLLWRKRGLTPQWVRAVISSDDFFVKDEWGRYDFARRVVDLRRREGVDPEEENEWQMLFRRGIHYSHMLFEDLMRISQDISPITGKAYVPIETVHLAHWTQSLLRHRITTRPHASGSSSPPPSREKELGITLSTAEILTTISSDRTADTGRTRPYYPVPFDTSQRIGDTDSAFASANASSADQLLAGAQDAPGPGHTPTDQAHFFGVLSRRYTAASCIQIDTTGKAAWSPHAPLRFAVEFWGVGTLPEKSRLYSRTIWYAGSLFNVYIQVVRKKGVQLGVYLHRQSSVDPLPRASAPPLITRADRALGSPARPPQPPRTPVRRHAYIGSSSSTATVAVPGSPTITSPPALTPSSPTPPYTPPSPTAPAQPYRDPRPVVSAYFTISCASSTGSSLTRFSSSPDQFAISQSWGWKSSSLRTEEYMEMSGEGQGPSKDVSLRATVVLGLI